MLRNGWKVVQDNIFRNLPEVEKDIAEHYMQNTKHIKATMEKVLNRELTNIEKDNLRQVCFELAIVQVGNKYEEELKNEKS